MLDEPRLDALVLEYRDIEALRLIRDGLAVEVAAAHRLLLERRERLYSEVPGLFGGANHGYPVRDDVVEQVERADDDEALEALRRHLSTLEGLLCGLNSMGCISQIAPEPIEDTDHTICRCWRPVDLGLGLGLGPAGANSSSL